MNEHSYTIVPDGAGGFNIDINFDHGMIETFECGFRSREAAVTFIQAREGANARIVQLRHYQLGGEAPRVSRVIVPTNG